MKEFFVEFLVILGISILISGCNIGPKYKKPTIKLPKQYSMKLSEGNTYDFRCWWTVFNSSELEKLINQGLQHNSDIKIALEKIVESRNIHRIDVAKLFPQIDLFGGVVRANLGDTLLTQGKLYDNVTPSIIALDSLWELDVWGRLYRTQRASQYQFQATIEDMHDVRVMLIAEIAQTYITLCALECKIRVLKETDALNKEIFRLYKDLFSAGLDTRQIPLEQTTAISLVETEIIDRAIEQRKAFNKLAFLLGTTPDQCPVNIESLHTIPCVAGEPPIDEPYALLRRRPDIRKAEKSLRASYEQIGAAVAEWFPKISLLGFLGRPSISSHQFPPGQAKLWTVGPLFNWPILDFGRIYFNINVQQSAQRQALVQYEKTVLNAIQDVENWLFSYVHSNRKLSIISASLEQEKKRFVLTRKLFISGLENRITELSGCIRVNEIIYEMLEAQESSALSFISLYKALGGGW